MSRNRFEANSIESERYPSVLYSLGEIVDSLGRSSPLPGYSVREMIECERVALQMEVAEEREQAAATRKPMTGILDRIRSRKKRIGRFWKKVRFKNPSECWEWGGARSRYNYGVYGMDGATFPAHRVAWALANNREPGELNVCHHCDNPPCCNPQHLFLGTDSDNMQDALRKGRMVGLKGEMAPAAKLTSAQVLEIRASKETARQAAERFGVSKITVKQIRQRRIWKHL